MWLQRKKVSGGEGLSCIYELIYILAIDESQWHHSHCPRLDDSKDDGSYRPDGSGRVGCGLVLGLILCAGALRIMRSVLYGVGVYDVPTILVVVLMLSAVTLLATTVPTLRVARIDPAKTLREE